MKQKTLAILFIVLCLAVLGIVVSRTFFKPLIQKFQKVTVPISVPTVALPTKTAEQIKIISQIKTYELLIYEDGARPKTLAVRLHDQVKFINKTKVPIRVGGEGWGQVLIQPEENLMKAFEEKGTFPFKVIELNPPVSGEVIAD